jgi:hypothetical protein
MGVLNLPRRASVAGLIAVALVLSLLAAACGSTSGLARGRVTIEALSPTPAVDALVGGKPAAPATSLVLGVTTPAAVETEAPADVATASPATETPAATSTPEAALASDGSTAPDTGRWIDVDVTTFVVRLMDGAQVTREITPVAVGALVDTGDYASTQTGLFHVYSKVEDLAYDPPYDTYISHWVGFDPDKANGFHSFLKDANGQVVDPGTGRISNGCIRTGSPDVIFAYAEMGMPVWVHH